ncbi:hypothetical protein EHV15_34990 [Paenibacillus oralis]|uniref:DUF5626 domain-containing protein n=1 Tax=Paenibacillus oralis TaxID=2490856 RepID=A0A3P3T9W4_9BACL|nr:hypothetical protein [Paenibacillus oralis]RRJ54797.1 hypothetical protein EHV15_34990 [Paenibacillus oralis]
MKRLGSILLALTLLVSMVSFTGAKASAQDVEGQASASQESSVYEFRDSLEGSSIDAYTTFPATDASTTDESISIQATNPFDLWLDVLSNGNLEGNWSYKSKGKIVTEVDLTMTLQYKEHWYNLTWDDVDSYSFDYAGSLSDHENNQHTWTPSEGEGHYRVRLTGQIRFIDEDGSGGHVVTLYSAQKTI